MPSNRHSKVAHLVASAALSASLLVAAPAAAAPAKPVVKPGHGGSVLVTSSTDVVKKQKKHGAKKPGKQNKKKHRQRKRVHVGGNRIIRIAASKRGAPYAYGAAGPNAFDCSGYTQWVYKHVGKNLPRTSSAQAAATRGIGRAAARPGDLVFFHSGGRVYHAAIYAGHNQIWHASKPGVPVGKSAIWSSSVYFGRVR